MSLFWGCIPLPPRARGARTPEASPQGASYQDHQAARAKRWSHARGPGQRAADPHKDIKDKSEALRAYARQARNPQLEADAGEIKKPAEDRLGALSAALEKAPPMQGRGAGLPAAGKSKIEALQSPASRPLPPIATSNSTNSPGPKKRPGSPRAAPQSKPANPSQTPLSGKATRRNGGADANSCLLRLSAPFLTRNTASSSPTRNGAFEPWSRDTSMDSQPERSHRQRGHCVRRRRRVRPAHPRTWPFLDLAEKEPRQRALTRLHATTGTMAETPSLASK